ncbi:MAG: hypothetical protein AABY11_03790, partial [archaeon]
ENASVSIFLTYSLLTSGFTDIEGIFPFELNEPSAGDTVKLRIEKAGYSPVEKTITVGADILSFVPASVAETLIVNGTTKKTKDVQFTNLASIPLRVDDIVLSGDTEGLVSFNVLNGDVLGETLELNAQRNLAFSVTLTEKGQKLLIPKNLATSVQVKLSNDETGKTFVAALPLALKIGFGGEVDVEDCLLVEPVEWNVFAVPGQAKQQAFEIRNTCTVDGSPVRLVELSAKLKQLAGDAVGSFSVTTDEKNVVLTTGFKVIQTSIPASGEVVATVTFTPASIQSGAAEPQIVFQALNPTETGVSDILSETVTIGASVNDLASCVKINTPALLEIDSCAVNTGGNVYGNYFNSTYTPGNVPYYNPSYSVLNKTSNPSGSSLLPSNQTGVYGAGGYDGFGNVAPVKANFAGQNTNYSSYYGPYGNTGVDQYNAFGGNASQAYGCSGTEIRIENSCQSDVHIELDADPNLQTSANAFALKPNEAQRVRINSGFRIGKYDVVVNARPVGSTDASKQIELVSVLVKSPTEVNADCIQLSTLKFRFNDFIQKPVKGKVINKCYDQGVRLVESADTITIASFFSADGLLSEEGNGSEQRKTSLVHDIQVIGMQTRGVGSDTYQEMEFQIFPDLTTYKAQPDLLLNDGGIGKRFSDLKVFAEANYYRVESYGTISVKYLDAYGAAQQKPFAVIFENLFNLTSAIDAVLQGGNTRITNFQECINNESLSPLQFGDESFLQGTTIAYTTKEPGQVLLTGEVNGEMKCGASDYILEILSPQTLEGTQNDLVQATFRVTGKQNIEATIVRPKNVQEDVTIEGTLRARVTRVFVNPGTQTVQIPVKITVLKPGKTTNLSSAAFVCQAGYESGNGFVTKYGFDKIKWDWTYNGSPNCSEQFCDATQLALYSIKKVAKLNEFIETNRKNGVFTEPQPSAADRYTTSNFIERIIDTVSVTSPNGGVNEYYLAKDGGLLEATATGNTAI